MNSFDILKSLFYEIPQVFASINGQGIYGMMSAYPYLDGSLVMVEVFGLPESQCDQGIHALHIHQGNSCIGDAQDPYKNVGPHFSLNDCPHPYHTGDLPPLFSNQGYAWQCFYTDKFAPNQIVNHTIIIHEKVDDFTSQPAGNAGKKIACGVIKILAC